MIRTALAHDLASDPNVAVKVSWSGPRPEAQKHFIDARVPIIRRSLTLDPEQLPPGEYELTVTVRPAGGGRWVAERSRAFSAR